MSIFYISFTKIYDISTNFIFFFKVKKNKQIILVSHNATIPMMGDAQQIIYCENNQGKIIVRSAPLERMINGIPVLDLIASITDGGKPSIKKRVKKYNLKKFTE